MKYFILLSQLLLLLVAASAKAQDGRDCVDQSARLSEQERTSFLTGCLAEASSLANVQEEALREKRRFCAQNAKNMALKGDEKSSYIKTCLNKNEAAEAVAKDCSEKRHQFTC